MFHSAIWKSGRESDVIKSLTRPKVWLRGELGQVVQPSAASLHKRDSVCAVLIKGQQGRAARPHRVILVVVLHNMSEALRSRILLKMSAMQLQSQSPKRKQRFHVKLPTMKR